MCTFSWPELGTAQSQFVVFKCSVISYFSSFSPVSFFRGWFNFILFIVVMVDTLECEGEVEYKVMICALMSQLAALVSVVMVLCSSSSLETISVRILIFSVPILKYFLLFQVCLGSSLIPLALVLVIVETLECEGEVEYIHGDGPCTPRTVFPSLVVLA